MKETSSKKQKVTNQELKQKLDQEVKLKQEYLNDLQRLQAEFQNYQKRIEQEKIELVRYSKQDLILKIIDILNNFEKAVLIRDNEEEFQKGISLILKQLKEVLDKEGVKEIKENYFDPKKHEVISVVEGEENKILEEFQKGYTLHDKVIKTSKVRVGKGGKNESESNTNKESA